MERSKISRGPYHPLDILNHQYYSIAPTGYMFHHKGML